MNKGLSVIVPAFNEGRTLAYVVDTIRIEARFAGLDAEIIVVDDGSTDLTAQQADLLAAEDPQTRAVHHPTNLGLRAAYESGLALARHDYVTWVPGDGEMAQASIGAIFQAVGTADLVIPYHGTPERRTWLRRLLTWGSTTQLNWLLGHDLHYYQGTVVYPTALARRLPRTVPGFFFCAEMLAYALDEGLSYVEVPLEHVERCHGVSKAVGWSKVWAAQKLILGLWWNLRAKTTFQALGWALEHR